MEAYRARFVKLTQDFQKIHQELLTPEAQKEHGVLVVQDADHQPIIQPTEGTKEDVTTEEDEKEGDTLCE